MKTRNSVKALGAGLLAGLVAALLMTLVLLLLRYLLGAATPSELVGDRLAPLLSIEKFFALLARFGGYNELKQIGFISVIGGQLVVGALGGLLYAWLVERAQPEQAEQRGRWFVAIFAGLLWLSSLILLWPVLGTSYVGLPPLPGTLANAGALLLAYALYGLALTQLYRLMFELMLAGGTVTEAASVRQPNGRRALFVGGAGAVLALAVGGILQRLYQLATFSYDGTRYKGADIEAITPNERFYVVTKNVVDPEVARSLWRLEIGGLVARPQTFRLADLAGMPAVTQETTLRCISNEIGDGLMSNAVWKGVPLRDLIAAAGPQPGVVEVLLHGVDNYTDTFAIEKALAPTTLVAYEMNGAPLPPRHGFPARVIVPGLFGEKNVKWVTRIELVGHDAKGFYEQQGWGPSFVVPTTARFDLPYDQQKFKLATWGGLLKGVAHGGDRGISQVEVSLDDGQTWRPAQLEHTGSALAWVIWKLDWRPAQAGEYKLVVRATDSTGALQTNQRRGTAPAGATGYHKITMQVES